MFMLQYIYISDTKRLLRYPFYSHVVYEKFCRYKVCDTLFLSEQKFPIFTNCFNAHNKVFSVERICRILVDLGREKESSSSLVNLCKSMSNMLDFFDSV